jgi:hypothetical protein
VPSFRPALVSGGVLVLCRELLDLFIAKLQVCRNDRVRRNSEANNNTNSTTNNNDYDNDANNDNNNDNDDDNKCDDDEEKLMACKSISNISLTLMFTIGGVSMFNNFSAPHLNGAHDYSITWIDHQVLNEDIPRAMIKLIHYGLQEWAIDNFPIRKPITTDNKNDTNACCPFRHLVCMNLAKALFQLSSRAANRPALSKIGVPQALCMIFVYATDVFETLTVSKDNDDRVLVEDLINETKNFSIECSCDEAVTDKVFSTQTVCASLDALTFFLNDLKASESSTNLYNSIPLTFTLSLPKPPSYGSLHDIYNDNDNTSSWLDTPVLTMMSYPSLIKGIKAVVTTLPRCPARLACLRVILSLTQWPDSLHALVVGDITDALVLISAEAELHRFDNNKSLLSDNNDQSRKAKDPERSCMFSIGSSPNGFAPYSTSNIIATSNSSGQLTLEPPIAKSNSNNSIKSSNSSKSGNDLVIVRNESTSSVNVRILKFSFEKACRENGFKEEDKAALTTEETMTVCLALANISQSKDYAIRLFKNGLLNIMFSMVDNTHFEISRQAVRCVSALCTVISSVVDTRSSAKQRNSQVIILILLQVLLLLISYYYYHSYIMMH